MALIIHLSGNMNNSSRYSLRQRYSGACESDETPLFLTVMFATKISSFGTQFELIFGQRMKYKAGDVISVENNFLLYSTLRDMH